MITHRYHGVILTFVLVIITFTSFTNLVKSECANACSGHGKCTSFDMCICYRNWQAGDCSERVCQFGLAHVDTPKGDLDINGKVSGPGTTIAENNYVYPYGTTEQFPAMMDSDGSVQANSAHYYMECSNRGLCDRGSGDCNCAEGYDGAACQRASCPGFPSQCSGHGVCKTIQQIANLDHQNVYELWDKKSTMGCHCDAGFTGPDCSERIYTENSLTMTDSEDFVSFTNGMYPPDEGHWAIRFFDMYGEDWLTEPIVAGATCDEVTTALYSLPNDVIPTGSLDCLIIDTESAAARSGPSMFMKETATDSLFSSFEDSRDDRLGAAGAHIEKVIIKGAFWDYIPELSAASKFIKTQQGAADATAYDMGYPSSYDTDASIPYEGYIYRIKFQGNPGKLRQPEIELFLDGERVALVATQSEAAIAVAETVAEAEGMDVLQETVITKVWTDGQQGENHDYVGDHCDGVQVTVLTGGIDVYNVTTVFDTGQTLTELVASPTDMQSYSYLGGRNGNRLTSEEMNLMKACLGGSDDVSENNIEVFDWDIGSAAFPHLVKLVRTVTSQHDGGYYAALVYIPYVDNAGSAAAGTDIFKLINPLEPLDGLANDLFDVYTTKGILARTTGDVKDASTRETYSEAVFGFASNEIFVGQPNYVAKTGGEPAYTGSVSCEYQALNPSLATSDVLPYCLNKTDLFFLFQYDKPALNPPHLNMYTAERLYTKRFEWSAIDVTVAGTGLTDPSSLATNVIVTDIATNWASAPRGMHPPTPNTAPQTFNIDQHPIFDVYKFIPNAKSTYEFVAQCSNRGLCNVEVGHCICYPGYTSDDCAVQSSIAV